MLCTIDKIQGYTFILKRVLFFISGADPEKTVPPFTFQFRQKNMGKGMSQWIDSKCGKAFDVLEIVSFYYWTGELLLFSLKEFGIGHQVILFPFLKFFILLFHQHLDYFY